MKKFFSDYKVLIAVVGGLAALALILRYLKGAADKAADTIAAPIADFLIPFVVGESVKVLGNVVLPNGNKIPLDGLHIKDDLQFDHQGVRYKITKRINGDYAAMRI